MFNIVLVVVVLSDGVGFCIFFLILVLSRFYRLGGVVKCVMMHSCSEVGMVPPSEVCVNGMFF